MTVSVSATGFSAMSSAHAYCCTSSSAQEEDVAKAYKTVKHELEAYGGGITDKPEIVALSQIDLLDEDELKKKTKALAKASGQTPFQISAVANVGMTGTLRALRDIIVQAKNSGSDD